MACGGWVFLLGTGCVFDCKCLFTINSSICDKCNLKNLSHESGEEMLMMPTYLAAMVMHVPDSSMTRTSYKLPARLIQGARANLLRKMAMLTSPFGSK
ncbi:hypothetical protein TRIUR3_32233 [Triticum urartu]|uniref:Uncharacterized protein n=1 Tax=Triticum urartu TaxID=4572 RepID=M7Z172_TRIUA|nr:hypothetical protein TRIUR3_32233 [Triticum urartu]